MRKALSILVFSFFLLSINSQTFILSPIDLGDGFAGDNKKIEWKIENKTEMEYLIHYEVEPNDFAKITPNPSGVHYTGFYRIWVEGKFKNSVGSHEAIVKLYVQKVNTNERTYVGTTKIKMNTVEPISAPTGLYALNTTKNSISIKWDNSKGGIGGVKEYDIYLNSVRHAITSSNSYTINDLNSNTIYSISIRARDKSNNLSPFSSTLRVSTLCDISSTITDNKNYTTESYVTKEATSWIKLTSGFKFSAIGNNNYIARIVKCGSPSTRIIMLDTEDNDESFLEEKETAGLSDLSSRFSWATVSLFPNPTTDVINIDLGCDCNNMKLIELYNLNGLKMESRYPTNQLETFEMYNYPTGVYIVKIMNENGESEFHKFIYK